MSRISRSPFIALLGPAMVADVAYLDPGNVASNITAGSRYGFLLVWVAVVAVIIAWMVQFLSARLGIVTGLSLPEVMGKRITSRGWRFGYWIQGELVAMATDVAEVVGGAIALHLLFGLPLWLGGVIVGVIALALLGVQSRFGPKPFERVIVLFILVIAVGFGASLVVHPVNVGDVVTGLVPRFDGQGSVLLATAILGATVMPHAIYAHSALSRERFSRVANADIPRLLKATRVDVTIALAIAGAVNIALIVVGGNVAFVLRGVGTEIGGMAAQIAALGRLDFQAFSNIGAAMREDADKSRKAFDAWERSIMTAGQTFNDYSNEGRGRGVAPDKTAGPTAAAIKKFIGPDGGGKGGGKTAKAIDEGARLIAHLQDQARAVQELTAVERLESEIADGKYKKVSAANLEQARGLAATIDAMKKSREEAKSAQDAFMAMSSEAAALFVAVRTPAEELEARIARLNELLESGAISMETFGRAAQEAGKSFQLIKPVLSEIDQFAVEAARNIQDAFAEFLFDPFKNGTEGMLKSFGDMIRRMIANAVAADLAKRLFGDFGKGDGVGGLLGDGLKWAAGFLKSANGNVFASPGLSAYSGSVVSRPTVFPFASGIGLMGEAGPEAILPLARGPNGKLGVQGGGHSITIHQTFNGATNPADVRRAGGAAAREALGALQSARRYA